MPSTVTKRYIGLQWRDFHIWDRGIVTAGNSVAECGKAYVTIYQGVDIETSKRNWTMCGKDTQDQFFEWEGDAITFRVYADFRRDPLYTYPTTPTRPSTTPTTPDPDCIQPSNVTENMTTSLPVCKTPKPPPSTTPLDVYPYPEVHFRADVSSFDYGCNESIPGEVFKCNDSQRCLDESMLCDFYFSQNCKTSSYPGDKSDQSRDAPSYCFRKDTTTPIPTTTTEAPPKPINWRPIAGALGGALAVLALCWCCWRPGYLPWRLARLRNVPFFNTQHCVCCRGRTVCCPCLKSCAGGGAAEEPLVYTAGGQYGRGVRGSVPRGLIGQAASMKAVVVPYGRLEDSSAGKGGQYTINGPTGYSPTISPSDFYGKDPNNFATDWLKFISGDGAHLREQR